LQDFAPCRARLRVADHVRWYRRWLSDVGAVAHLGDQGEHVVELALLDAVGGTFAVKQAVRSEQPQMSLIGLVELG
jgi:hypothetical protein